MCEATESDFCICVWAIQAAAAAAHPSTPRWLGAIPYYTLVALCHRCQPRAALLQPCGMRRAACVPGALGIHAVEQRKERIGIREVDADDAGAPCPAAKLRRRLRRRGHCLRGRGRHCRACRGMHTPRGHATRAAVLSRGRNAPRARRPGQILARRRRSAQERAAGSRACT